MGGREDVAALEAPREKAATLPGRGEEAGRIAGHEQVMMERGVEILRAEVPAQHLQGLAGEAETPGRVGNIPGGEGVQVLAGVVEIEAAGRAELEPVFEDVPQPDGAIHDDIDETGIPQTHPAVHPGVPGPVRHPRRVPQGDPRQITASHVHLIADAPRAVSRGFRVAAAAVAR